MVTQARLLRPARLLILGPPGSGKGTQTDRLVKQFRIPALSSGDILRRQIDDKTSIGNLASGIIRSGELLPDAVMTSLITSELEALQWLSSTSTFLLDGFPRTQSQAEQLDHRLDRSGAALNLVVQLKVPVNVILNRIANRLVHVKSGRVYNLTYNPPKIAGIDDVTGEPLVRRPDDDPQVFKRRLDEYASQTEPLVKYYKSKPGNVLWSVAGDSSNVIFPKLQHEILARFG
ncbi:adenylate kinase-domain-containing protein [Lipomyces japonicus]|uniref:adenylate kinase-domain-containing protein n=1 Tax=Lipomyces japonicus TaxID=56871 RepID=UPI0034CE935C